MASLHPVQLPPEIKELIIDELALGGEFLGEIIESHAALCSCLFVSRQFRRCTRRHLFRNISFSNLERLPDLRKKLILLHQLMKTPANNHSLGIVSEIRSFSIVTGFGDHDEDSDVEDEYGEEENTIAKVIAKYLPGILKLLMTDARGLQHFHIEDQTDPLSVGYDWMSLPPELRSTVRALLIFRPLKRLDLRNFTEVPNDFFHQTNVAHLITKNFLSRETELRFDDSPSGSSFDGMQLTFGAVETLDTDQYFPIHRMVDMSRNHPSRPSQAHFLKNIKLFVWNEDDFNQVIHLLHAAYLAEDLFLNFTPLFSGHYKLGAMLDLFPMQKLTSLTLKYAERLFTSSQNSVPQSLEHASALLGSGSSSLVSLTLTFNFDFLSTDDTQTRDDLTYQLKDEHWKPLDSALSGPSYPMLRCIELHIDLNSENDQLESRLRSLLRNVFFETALPLLSASELLDLYID